MKNEAKRSAIKKNKKGRKPHVVTDEAKHRVRTLAGFGLKNEQIAAVMLFSRSTLERHYQDQLDLGRAVALATVTETAFKMATSGDNTTMTIFWLKTQAGWREVSRDINVNQTVHHIETEKSTVRRMALEGGKSEKARRKQA